MDISLNYTSATLSYYTDIYPLLNIYIHIYVQRPLWSRGSSTWCAARWTP